MSSKGEIQIVLKAVDQASKTFKSVSNKLKSSFSKIKKSFDDVLKVGLGFGLASIAEKTVDFTKQAVELGGQIETLEASFERLKEASGAVELSLDQLRNATKGTVSDVELLTAANQALSLGLPADDLDKLFESAMKLGHAMGISTKQAVESLTLGLGRQSKQILDNLGVVFKAEDAYLWYAEKMMEAGVAIGDELTEEQKAQAWREYAIKLITERAKELGDVVSETQIKQERWNAAIQNFQATLGKVLIPIIDKLVAFLEKLWDIFGKVWSIVSEALMPVWEELQAAWNELVDTLFGFTDEASRNKELIKTIADIIVFVLKPALKVLIGWIRMIKDGFEKLKPVVEAIKMGFEALAKAWETITNFGKGVMDALGGIGKSLSDVGSNLFRSPETIFDHAAEGVVRLRRAMRGLKVGDWGGLGGLDVGVMGARGGSVGSVVVNFNVSGSMDKRTAELAAKLIEEKLKTVLVESTSPNAPTKRIRITRR